MPITIKLFAIYRELAGQPELTIEYTPGLSVVDLYQRVFQDRIPPGLRKVTLFAINEQYVPEDKIVGDGDRVAFIPPVSGG